MTDRWVDVYDNCDKAFVTYVHSLLYWDGIKETNLLCVFATPERALARIQKRIADKTGQDIASVPIPLPFASISRMTEQYDPERYTRAELRRIYTNQAGTRYLHTFKPQPWTLTYQTQIWARNLRDLDAFRNQFITSLRGNEAYLNVKYAEPFGTLLNRIQLDSVNDASEIETNEEQRILRRVFTFKMETWIPYGVREVGPILSVHIREFDSEDLVTEGALLDTIQVPDDA